MKNKIEIRNAGHFEKEENSRKIHGLAIPVDSRSALLYDEFYETVNRSAVTEDLINGSDIKLYLNHDSSQGTLARSKYGKGSLRLYITDAGLEFETELPDTERGNELLRGIERGDYDAISFAFVIGNEHFDDKPDTEGHWHRYIDSFEMVDEISILSCLPAYPATSVDMRSLEETKNNYNKQIIEKLDSKLQEIENLNI